MNEEIERGSVERKTLMRDGLVALVLASILQVMSFTSFLYTCPLLFFGARHGKKNFLNLALIEGGVVVVYNIFQVWGTEFLAFNLALGLSIPVSLLAAGTLWVMFDEGRLEKRVLLSFLPPILCFIGMVIYLQMDRALLDVVYGTYRDVFANLLSDVLGEAGLGLDVEYLYFVMVTMIAILILPMVLAAVCVTCFLYSSMLHSKESDWEDRVEAIEFNQDLIWVLVLFVALSLISRFVSIPLAMEIALMALLLSLVLFYGIQGFSVVFSWIRRVSPNSRSLSLLIGLGFFSIMVPGLNMIVLFGIPALGVLENFFNLKKRKEK